MPKSYTSKFAVGEKVWRLHDNKVVEQAVDSVEISEVGDLRGNFPATFTSSVKYGFRVIKVANQIEWVHFGERDNKLFATNLEPLPRAALRELALAVQHLGTALSAREDNSHQVMICVQLAQANLAAQERKLLRERNQRAEKLGEGTWFRRGSREACSVDVTFYPKTKIWITEGDKRRETSRQELQRVYQQLEL